MYRRRRLRLTYHGANAPATCSCSPNGEEEEAQPSAYRDQDHQGVLWRCPERLPATSGGDLAVGHSSGEMTIASRRSEHKDCGSALSQNASSPRFSTLAIGRYPRPGGCVRCRPYCAWQRECAASFPSSRAGLLLTSCGSRPLLSPQQQPRWKREAGGIGAGLPSSNNTSTLSGRLISAQGQRGRQRAVYATPAFPKDMGSPTLVQKENWCTRAGGAPWLAGVGTTIRPLGSPMTLKLISEQADLTADPLRIP